MTILQEPTTPQAPSMPSPSPLPLPRGARSKEPCHCSEIFILSNNEANNFQPDSLGVFRATTSNNFLHFWNPFGSAIYKNTNELSLIGGRNQYWRIQNWKREKMIRHNSCKEACPIDCTQDWEVYKNRVGYVKVRDLTVECREEDDGSGHQENAGLDSVVFPTQIYPRQL